MTGDKVGLEPQVEKSIRIHRRRHALHVAISLLPMVIIVVVSVVLALVLKSSGDQGRGFYDLLVEDRATQGVVYSTAAMYAFVLGLRFAPYFVYIAGAFWRLILPAMRQYKSLTGETVQYDPDRYRKFDSYLAAVSVGMGIPKPELTVLDLPTANSISYMKKRAPAVGVTPELLRADLSGNEIESVMAHEAAHIAAGDTLRSPNVFKGLGGAVFLLAIIALPFLFPIGAPKEGQVWLYALSLVWVPLMAIVAIPISAYLFMKPYTISRLNPSYYHRAILADSVAAKLTGNPGAAMSALEKVVRLMNEADRMPSQTIAFTQLFQGPLKPWPYDSKEKVASILEGVFGKKGYDPGGEVTIFRIGYDGFRSLYRGLSKDAPGEGSRYTDPHREPTARESMTQGFIRWESKLLRARLENLELIKRNYYKAFEVRDGRPFVRPERWYS